MHADVIVVGLGAVGSAAAWQLARRGARVLGVDRFTPPHDRGSSHGLTRVTREAVGEGEAYVPLVQRSHALWREIEATLGAELDGPLMTRTGVLVIGPARSDAAFVERTRAVAAATGVPHETLDATAVHRRWPQFRLQDHETACFEPGGGVLHPERCVAAQLALARRHGATLIGGQPVRSIARVDAGYAVTTAAATHQAPLLLLSAGAWLPGLLRDSGIADVLPWTQALRVRRQTLHWLAPEDPTRFLPAACPTFIWTRGHRYEDSFYGMPMLDGVPGVKVGTEQFEHEADPDAVSREVDAAETADLFERLVRPRLAGLSGNAVQRAACLYTMADDGRFRIDSPAAWPGLTLVSACSGHGFKHSAALGEAVAERLLQGRSSLNLGAFAPG
jgi:sarcosine oxidase